MFSEKIHHFSSSFLPFEMLTSGLTETDGTGTTQKDMPYHERENSPFYIIEYVCEGSGVIICNGKTYEVSTGDCFLLPKGSNHSYYTDIKWRKIWFNIDGSLVRNLLHAYQLKDTVVFKNFNNQECFEKLYTLTSTTKNDRDLTLKAALQFHHIIQQLFVLNSSYEISVADKVKKYIENNLYQQKISVHELAERFFVSQTTLIEEFKKKYHSTPYQYFISKRISLAISLLMDSSHSISEISELLNYSDSSSFSNAFKKYTGLSPKDYKKINSHPSSFKFLNVAEEPFREGNKIPFSNDSTN